MANAVDSTFPHPPPFYQLYSGKTEQGEDVVPPAPPAPIDGEFVLYGTGQASTSHLPPLPGQHLVQHRPDGKIDIKSELRRLNTNLAIALDQLMDTLEKAPAEYARPLEMVIAILNNLVYLTNLLRPIQARATLQHMLKERVQQKRALLQALEQDSGALHRIRSDLVSAIAQSPRQNDADTGMAIDSKMQP